VIKIGFGAFAVLLMVLIPGLVWHRSILRVTREEV